MVCIGVSFIEGSSPLTRGKPGGRVSRFGKAGLIPAHAGKTLRSGTPACDLGAHPRSRGENLVAGAAHSLARGSSPLTRGKLFVGRFACGAARLIPAHAGKTRSFGTILQLDGAHPRSRGENVLVLIVGGGRQGSSPLTRGKRVFGEGLLEQGGLIPAHAGKTGSSVSSITSARAHPRSRGENDGRRARRPP